MAQVEPEDLEPVCPLAEVRLLRIALRRVPGKARGHDEPRAAAQQLEAGLVADLHASAGQERHPAVEIGQLGALREVQLRAGRAQLVVEMVNVRVFLLADVAMPQDRGFTRSLRAFIRTARPTFARWKDVGGGEHRPPAQHPDPAFVENRVLLPLSRRPALALGGPQSPAARERIGEIDPRHRLVQALADCRRQVIQHGAVGGDAVEQLNRRTQALQQRRVGIFGERRGFRLGHRQGCRRQRRHFNRFVVRSSPEIAGPDRRALNGVKRPLERAQLNPRRGWSAASGFNTICGRSTSS
jgi:hypothetical protein